MLLTHREKKKKKNLCLAFVSPKNESWQVNKTKKKKREQTCQTP